MSRLIRSMVVAAAAGLTATAAADDINVPADHSSIQAAIDAAGEGDVILVAPGTYSETIDLLGKTITLRGTDGPATTTIDGGGLGTVVTCQNGEGPGTKIEGFTITGGTGTARRDMVVGGGMVNDLASPTVINCLFTGNSAGDDGGAMFNQSGSPTVLACTFINNTAQSGGGVYNLDAPATIINCQFIENHATTDRGGGVYNDGSSSVLRGCTFESNTAVVGGGGLFNRISAPIVSGCTFLTNQSVGPGGGARYFGLSGGAIVNCQFIDNTGDVGGGLACFAQSSPTVSNCLFDGNSAQSGGAIHVSFFSSPVFANCTMRDNTATEAGGGVLNDEDGSATIVNSVLWANTPDQLSLAGSAAISHCLVQGGFAGVGIIDADPLFDGTGIRPLRGSPCIDAGQNDAVVADLADLDMNGDTTEPTPLDLDGNARFIDDPKQPDTGNGRAPIVDLGAFEFPALPPPPCPTDLNDDGTTDVQDLIAIIVAWGTTRPDPADVNEDGVVNVLDLVEVIVAWGSCGE